MKHLSFTVFVIIFSCVLLPSCDLFFEQNKDEATELEMQQAKLDSIRVADSLKKEQDALLAVELARNDSIRLAEEVRLASKYHIIVGSFYIPANAKRWADEYKRRGYNTQILQKKGSMFELVSAESFSSHNEAQRRLRYFTNYIMPDAWIYIDE
jgi:hypothetical protein